MQCYKVGYVIPALMSLCKKKYILFSPKQYKCSDLNSALYGILSLNPPIFYVAHWMDEKFVFQHSLDMLFDFLRYQNAYFLYVWFWYIEDSQRLEMVKEFEKRHKRKHSDHHFIHLCNTVTQSQAFEEKGLHAIFCNQNAMVDENIFKPIPSVTKMYDAIYDGRLKSYKRHYLAKEIESLALIYAFNSYVDDINYVNKVRREFTHAHFFNHPDASEYICLEPSDVNQSLNACRVGLCLSSIEGAMYSSLQYLLSGLPVVSTRSLGGREVFFDEEYVLIVEDKAEAVRRGVRELIERRIPAHRIRHKTLEKMRDHRLRLISLVQEIYRQEGVNRDFACEWNEIFFNKLLKWQSHADTIELLNRGFR
jgi:glycosyltransferase involved in cell wall biosynthesis